MWVLVADDDLLVARSTAAVLSHAGYRVEIAPDGRKAIERLTQERFDLFLCDWLMPDVDGTAVVRALRASGKETPAIILTSALHGPLPLQHAQRVGADGFLQKPASSQALLNAVRSALAKRQAGRVFPAAAAGGHREPVGFGSPARPPRPTPAGGGVAKAAPGFGPAAGGLTKATPAPVRPAPRAITAALVRAAEAKSSANAVRAVNEPLDEPIVATERSPTWPPDAPK
jgi:CheY-like chemotaxis protein